MIETLSEKDVVARKAHRCGLCERDIPKGTTHYTQRNADGLHIWTWRAHIECNAAYLPFLRWCGIEPQWLDDYETVDHDEFRKFVDNRRDTA